MKFGGWWQNFWSGVFPVFCSGCEKEGEFLCENCLKIEIEKINNSGLINIDFCNSDFLRAESLDRLTALFNYQNNLILSTLLKIFKYNSAIEIAGVWNKILAQMPLNFSVDYIIPIPLHPRRERERGFNQSELIASFLANFSQKNLSLDLLRIRYTTQQAILKAEQRKENILEAFIWVGQNLLGKDVMLVDDVYTTGSTLNEAARILKSMGARQVFGFVLAKD